MINPSSYRPKPSQIKPASTNRTTYRVPMAVTLWKPMFRMKPANYWADAKQVGPPTMPRPNTDLWLPTPP